MGAGWQHQFATRLLSAEEPGTVIIVSPKGNRWRYRDTGNGQFQAFPGVYSTLLRAGDTYTQTLSSLEQVVFDVTGRVSHLLDAQGRRLNLIYGASSGQLSRIVDATNSQRSLDLSYHGDGRLSTVSAGTRTVTYTYTAGDLATVTDVMGRTTTYTYQNHLLTGIDNAMGQAVERTTYDSYTPAGKAIRQALLDGQQLDFQYLTATTTITTTAPDGRHDVEVIAYNASNTVASISRNGQLVQGSVYDGNFAPEQIIDANGNATSATFTSIGQPLYMSDALGHSTSVTYDAHSHPSTVTDALGRQSLALYDDANNLIRQTTGITTAFPLGFTTVYTYNARYLGKHWLEEQRTADGVVTRYDYDAQGHVTTTTVGYGTALAQISTSGYDPLGRVITTTVGVDTPLERQDAIRYNDDDSVAQTIQNYQNGVFDPAHPDEDLIRNYGYDALGRQVWVRDTLGHYDVTQYDAAGRVDWTLRNLYPVQLDAQGQPALPANPPAYSPNRPDTNVATLFGYDGLGRTTLVTETGILTGTFDAATRTFGDVSERVTRTEYDDLSRPITTTLNYRPGLPMGTLPDVNVQTITRYDNAGNITWQRDALGRWTHIEYDALSRPITTTVNYENGNPLTVNAANQSWTDGTDTDIVTVLRYTVDGQIEREIDNYVDGVFTATAPITDRLTLYQYDALGRAITTTLAYDPATLGTRSDTNRVSATAYDAPTGRTTGQRDVLGRWVSQQYDALGRATTTIQNCRNAQGTPVALGCAAFDNVTRPDRNVPYHTRYDALGRAWETVDALDHVTRMSYDTLGQPVATTQNYQAGQAATADTNVTTQSTYDALGRVTRTTDTLGAMANTTYDGLGRAVMMTDRAGRVTRAGYDGSSAPRWSLQPDGRLTLFRLDGLGRVVATITNYQDGGVSAGDAADQDLMTRTVYDTVGRQLQTIDAAGRVTVFGYNLRDQLISVRENQQAGTCSAAPCNVEIRYAYDRTGNRTAITDAQQQTRRFVYDAADRQIEERDALDQATTWEYDALGRVTMQRDGRGSANDVQFSYDELDRRTQTEAPNLAAPITAEYDALGRRQRMTDATGTTSFTFDALSRITQLSAPETGSVGFVYDARGQRTQLSYPDGPTITYQYWPDGQLHKVTQGGVTLAEYTYDSAGRPEEVTRANGTTTTHTYDGADRMLELSTRVNGTLRSRFAYTVDRLGQRTAITETLAGQTRTLDYTYDGLLRLTGAVDSAGVTSGYSYDLAGNRTSVVEDGVTTETRSYNAANQVVGWQYDDAGNLLNDGTTTSTYDPLNRLLTTTSAGQSRTNTYNGDNVLVAQIANGTTTRYTQDLVAPLAQVLQVTQGVSTTDYVYGSERLFELQGIQRTWHTSDALGSLRQTLDNAGMLLSALHYDPWGTPQSGTTPAPFGFTGEVQDAASGLVHLRARWYQPNQATFLSRDPFAGFETRPVTLHPYQYVGNSPVNLTDPAGECFPPLEELRRREPLNCHNLDMAGRIYHHPRASAWEKTQALAYITVWTGGHVCAIVGGGILAAEFSAALLSGSALAKARAAAAATPAVAKWAWEQAKRLGGRGAEQAASGNTNTPAGNVATTVGRIMFSGPQKVVPQGYVAVSRWVNAAEAKLWIASGGTRIPPNVGSPNALNTQTKVYVTLQGTTKPGGTGPIRIDFHVPQQILRVAGKAEWRQIFQPVDDVPIYNVNIYQP